MKPDSFFHRVSKKWKSFERADEIPYFETKITINRAGGFVGLLGCGILMIPVHILPGEVAPINFWGLFLTGSLVTVLGAFLFHRYMGVFISAIWIIFLSILVYIEFFQECSCC
jgi:hypothetical protein